MNNLCNNYKYVDVLLTVHLTIILVIDQLNEQIFIFIFAPCIL